MALEIIIILSMVQGVTEFLPISSSAHLIIISEIFESISSKRSFDVSLHFGSLLAVIFYLKKDISKIAFDTFFLKKSNEGFITFKNLSLKEAFIIGLFQILALIPGTSRSGIVITAGLFMGYSRYDASKYSLLLSIPVIIAAMTLESFSLFYKDGFFFDNDMAVGIILSFCSALITIKLFMKWINTASLKIFVIYRVFLGTVILIYAYY